MEEQEQEYEVSLFAFFRRLTKIGLWIGGIAAYFYTSGLVTRWLSLKLWPSEPVSQDDFVMLCFGGGVIIFLIFLLLTAIWDPNPTR